MNGNRIKKGKYTLIWNQYVQIEWIEWLIVRYYKWVIIDDNYRAVSNDSRSASDGARNTATATSNIRAETKTTETAVCIRWCWIWCETSHVNREKWFDEHIFDGNEREGERRKRDKNLALKFLQKIGINYLLIVNKIYGFLTSAISLELVSSSK